MAAGTSNYWEGKGEAFCWISPGGRGAERGQVLGVAAEERAWPPYGRAEEQGVQWEPQGLGAEEKEPPGAGG